MYEWDGREGGGREEEEEGKRGGEGDTFLLVYQNAPLFFDKQFRPEGRKGRTTLPLFFCTIPDIIGQLRGMNSMNARSCFVTWHRPGLPHRAGRVPPGAPDLPHLGKEWRQIQVR